MSINVIADEESDSSSQFRAFRWTDEATDDKSIEARHLNRLIGLTIDVTDGVRALLELAEFDDWLLVDDHTPLIDRCRHDSLRRFSVSALRLLSEEAERVGEWVRSGVDC